MYPLARWKGGVRLMLRVVLATWIVCWVLWFWLLRVHKRASSSIEREGSLRDWLCVLLILVPGVAFAPRSFGDFANVSGVMIWGFVSSWIIIPLLRRLKNQEGLLDLLIAFMLSAAWMTSAFVVGLAWGQIFKIATTQ
jgi:uncharacterized membrane protein YjjP (DUF1212 family)